MQTMEGRRIMFAIDSPLVQNRALSRHWASFWIQKQVSRLGPLMSSPMFGVGLSMLALVPLLLI